MTRPPDLARREELLAAIVDYVLENGLADLSLRPLAEAVGSSPRVLLYYWGSKAELVQAIVEAARARQLVGFAAIRDARYESVDDACLDVWKIMTQPKHEPLFRFFFELFGIALQDRKAYASFLHHAINDWLQFFARPLTEKGVPERDARAYGTIVLAGFRGFLMDFCATHDRARIDRAVSMWLRSLDAFALVKEHTVDS
jgi:AcrR family transcriptional regulator